MQINKDLEKKKAMIVLIMTDSDQNGNWVR